MSARELLARLDQGVQADLEIVRRTACEGVDFASLPVLEDAQLPAAMPPFEPAAYVLTVAQALYGLGSAGNC